MNDRLLAGKIVNTHGIRGEVKVLYYTDSPQFFENIKNVILSPGEEYALAGARAHKGAVLLKLSGVDTIEEAEKLIGKEIYALREEAPIPDGQFFIVDIIGCTVKENDREIGKVTDVFPTGSNDVFETLLANGKKAYIPNIHDVIKKIDIINKEILVHIPEGLIDDED